MSITSDVSDITEKVGIWLRHTICCNYWLPQRCILSCHLGFFSNLTLKPKEEALAILFFAAPNA